MREPKLHACRTLVGCGVDIHNRGLMVRLFRQAIQEAGAHIKGQIKVTLFPNGGLTLQAALEESNADLHTYKEENNLVIVDIITCSNGVNPLVIIGKLAQLLKAEEITRRLIKDC